MVLALVVRARWGEALELSALVALLHEAGASPWALAGNVAIYLLGTTLFVPSVVFHVAAGAALGFERAVGLNFLLANLASNLHFFAGRALGGGRVAPWLAQRGWTRVHAAVQGADGLTMVIVRQLPLPFLGVNLAAGTTPMRWRGFLLGNAVGLLPQVLIYTYFASAIAAGAEGARRDALIQGGLAGAGLIALGVGGRVLAARWQRRQA